MDSQSRGFYGQQRPMLQPNLRSKNAPRSIAEDEEEGVAKRRFTGKRRKTTTRTRKLAQQLKF